MPDPFSALAALWAELRRRKVVRVGAAYLGGAFVLLQVADLVIVPIGLPESLYTVVLVALLLGFPVALALAWSFDMRPDGSLAPDGALGGARTRRLGRAALVFLILLSTAAAGVALAMRFRTAGGEAGRTLAVLPFAVRGSDALSYLDQGMVDLLSRNLNGAAELRTVAPEMVLSVTPAKAPTEAVPADRAQEIARRLGARWYLLGSISQIGGRVRITAAFHDAREEPGHAVIEDAVEGDTTELLSLVDHLSAKLLAARDARAASRLTEIAALTTRSLPALKEYLRAEQALRSATFDSAIAGFERAAHIDTAFALAYYRAAAAANTSFGPRHYTGSRRRLVERAMLHRAGLPAREQALLDALVAANRGRIDEAERRYRAILRERPDELEAMLHLGNMLLVANPSRGRPPAEGGEYLAAVLEADPQFLCPI